MSEYSKILQLLSINGESFNFTLDEGAIVTEPVKNSTVLPEINTFDAEWLDKAIQDIINGNYNKNIFISKHSSYINRFDFKSNQFKIYDYKSNNKSIYINININLILPENRKKYKKSEYFNKLINIKDLEDDRDIFSIVPRVIVAGKLLENFKVFCNESMTSIVLEAGTDITRELCDMMMRDKLNVTIITFPRYNDYEEKKHTKNVSPNINAARLRRAGARLGRVITIKSDYFQIPLDKGLVHPENILVFSNDNFIHEAVVESYYPNIYRVVNTPEHLTRLTLYIFYNGAERHIRNEVSLYHDNVEDICQEFHNEIVPQYIKDYEPIRIEYSIEDYRNSKYDFPVEYKMDVLRRLIDFNASYVKEYLKYFNTNNVYYVDLKNLNLQAKLRLDNALEIDKPEEQVKFSESRYVFIFKKDLVNNKRSFRIFIDGEFYVADHVYSDTFYDFIYIPATLIKPDTVFSIEIIYEFITSLTGTLNSFDEEFVLTIGEYSENVVAKDIKIFSGGERISNTSFKGFIETDAGMVQFNLDSNTHIGNRTIYIRIIDTELYGQPIEFLIEKEYNLSTHNYSDLTDNIIPVSSINEDNVNKILVYKNSRLLSSNMYNIGEVDGKYFVQLLPHDYNIYDKIHIEINPYFSNEVFYSQEISSDGFIDLYRNIDKPIDTRWYDIYLNGRRMEDNNIKIISPYKAIIHNVHSTSNLVFIEKNRDSEYFPIRNKNIEDLIWENEEKIRQNFLTAKINSREGAYRRV